MSFDDYANHIYQKHRLAVALAIIKSRPENMSTTKFLEELKSKFDEQMDEDEVTVCSDDFLFEDDDDMNDSVNILNDFDPEKFNGGNDEIASVTACKLPQYLTQTTYYDGSQSQSTSIPEHTINDKAVTDDINNKYHHIEDTTPSIQANQNEFHPKMDYNHEKSIIQEKSFKNTDSTYYDSRKTILNTKESTNIDSNNDSQKTVLYTVSAFDNNTHYSASQADIFIPNKYIYGVNRLQSSEVGFVNANNNNIRDNDSQYISESPKDTISKAVQNISNDKTHENIDIDVNLEYSQTLNIFPQNIDENYNQRQHSLINDNYSTTENNRNTIEDNTVKEIRINTHNIDEYFEEMQHIIENDIPDYPGQTKHINNEFSDIELANYQNHNTFSQNINDKNDFTPDIQIHTQTNNTLEIVNTNDITTQNIEINTKIVNKSNNFDNKEEIIEEYDHQEIISYKILEEFNKVKTFLNRERRLSCDGYSTDSGYRSDSQIRSSNRSALQLSGNWLSQSGCCLFNYITQCPLVEATRDITQEIAQVLSQLIDKLHEQENYPSFLEDLLDTVDLLLRQLYEGESSDTEFLKKDEHMQRILLLNKSLHIQHHTIEKISKILQNFHSKITETDITFEITNIDEIENITYIFHILEILLKKYLKNKQTFSQYTQSQDEEKILKKSSITDIWRKKWNPDQKVFEGSQKKICVLKLCSEVLNKIVVNCVNNYSLVAYSALNCFNCMQS